MSRRTVDSIVGHSSTKRDQLHDDPTERRIRLAFWAAAITIAGVRAWDSRFQVGRDAMSYLNLGENFWRHDWPGAVSPHWSPLYPILSGAVLGLLRPAIPWKIPAVHLLNFVVLAATLASFDFFWCALLAAQGHDPGRLPRWVMWTLGYLGFICVSFEMITVALVGPDLLFTGFLYLSAGLLLRIRADHGRRWSTAFGLGLAMGGGYLAKAPFLPITPFFLAGVWAASRQTAILPRATADGAGASPLSRGKLDWATPIRNCLIAVLGVALVAGPWLTVLSQKAGHFTAGYSARLNWAWFVNGVPERHWQGGPPSCGMPEHPTRQVVARPATFVFADGPPGVYSPWFDPEYWQRGVRLHLDLRRQLELFVRGSLSIVGKALEFAPVLLAAALALLFSGLGTQPRVAEARSGRHRWARYWYVWISGVAGLLMFACIEVEPRYIGGFLMLVWAGLLATVPASKGENAPVALRAIALGAVITVGTGQIISTLYDVDNSRKAVGRSPEPIRVALALRTEGVTVGDRIGVIGNGISAYWAWLAGLRVIAEVPEALDTGETPALDFWTSPPETQALVLQAMAVTGAKLVVTRAIPGIPPSGWQRLSATAYYVYFLH